jgi:aspartyl-tRNA(Asn)/glutamyl-tRNA(Gln) amidotransferase subunit C
MTDQPPPASALTSEQVRKVAALARLSPSDAQIEKYRTELGAILTYVERLRGLDLSSVDGLPNPAEHTNRLRPDTPAPGLPQSALMEMAPKAHAPFVAVPRILGDAAVA